MTDQPTSQETTPEPAVPQQTAPPAARPIPRPLPAKLPPRKPAAPVAVRVAPTLDGADAAEAARWGRVDDDGTVWVREADGERPVGQFPGASVDDALALYVRRYLDLKSQVALLASRLPGLSAKDTDATIASLREALTDPAAVGDLAALRSQLDDLEARAGELRAAAAEERRAAKEVALAARTELVEQAEALCDTPEEQIQWRPASEQLRELLDKWKAAQRSGPRIDRVAEDALWKRFSHARTVFDRKRKHHFTELEQRNSAAKEAKEKLVTQAEALSTSTDWGATAAAFRDLMDQWRRAGRAARRDDDALWERFRAAQDAFFSARNEQLAASDAEQQANLAAKEEILKEAETLVPVTDIAKARAALREIQERWEGVGRVPRADLGRVEARMRAVEQAIRDAEQDHWRASNPETKARTEGAASQLHAVIDQLEQDLQEARSKGDSRKASELEVALAARRSWLEQIERTAGDLS